MVARPAEVVVVQLHWWAMYCSLAERRSPILVEKLEGNLGEEAVSSVLLGSDDGPFDILAVSEGGTCEMGDGEVKW